MPTPREEGLLEVNRQYQEAIKIVITLVTACLGLPIVFLKTILGRENSSGHNYLKDNPLAPWAYASWVLLAVSLVACVAFYYFSSKFTKALYGLYGEEGNQKTWEHRRDVTAWIVALSTLAGLISLSIFLLGQV